ncbi:MAG TPA: T9SS type A sorting domain-containing protein [Flavobacterium sp.]|nr:T9SS type A sorting domain-containing protein [Flavobacterium sp.]
MKKNIFWLSVFFILMKLSLNAQILYQENFDNYVTGNVGTDITGATPGQGDWHTREVFTNYGTNDSFRIEPESGRGKVLIIESLFLNERTDTITTQRTHRIVTKEIGNIWSLRNPQNNILKVEWQFKYFINKIQPNYSPPHITIELSSHRGIFISEDNEMLQLQSNHIPVFPSPIFLNSNTWETVIMYIDSTSGGSVYFEIPSLNHVILSSLKYPLSSDTLCRLGFYMTVDDNYLEQYFLKVDNITISAVNTLPKLNIDDFVSSKFNIFPNPVTDILTITNSENIGIEEIMIYDINGKKVKRQNFNTRNEVQLNIRDFTSGTYMLHIKTNEGVAVKKVVKK